MKNKDHFKEAREFFAGLKIAQEHGLDYEYVQWFLDELITTSQTPSIKDGRLPTNRTTLVNNAVTYALYEWDM